MPNSHAPRRLATTTPVALALAFACAFAFAHQPLAAQLHAPPVQFWNEGSPDLVSSLQEHVRFGAALAAGDYNCDGFDDLAVGVPEDDDNNGALADTGYVLVLYGSSDGLVAVGHQLWDQQSLAAASEEAGDQFGEVLAAGDFDDDGCDDLAVGMPHEDIGDLTDAGGLQLIYGSSDGLADTGNTFFRQGAGGITAAPEDFDRFGQSLAVGDFNADGIDDLALGAPGEDIEAASAEGAGALHVLFGSVSGLTGDDDLVLFRGSGLPGTPETGEGLATALASADFNPLFPGADLAIGAPSSAAGDVADSGRVLLFSDITGSGFVAEYTQATTGVPGLAETFDQFGATLAGGDFDGDGIAELAVGSPGEDLEAAMVTNAGAVTVLDFDGDGHTLWLQDDLAPEHAEGIDEFGSALAAGDFNADGIDDLAIGVPKEDLGPVTAAGLVHVLHGAEGSGLSANGDQIWIQAVDPAEDVDQFGFALAVGRFAGHSSADLAVGAPGEALSGNDEAGAVNVFFSRQPLLVDGFESGDTSAWSAVTLPPN